ncbi:hypothetical protein [Cupriavidus oxalaticus]|uniref:Uncharacterized protein n=1 Tax=Cupriavidus oxalaticus TaxID=96344 RepID=A0A5P3VRD1_9BURK|nr:hypothetical protein [Cupriavidus oxalaticus]QEZ48906.1 hypothetical protein D2917_32095 [Cupriavidus oxalaticus]
MSLTSKGLTVSFTDNDGERRQYVTDADVPCTEKSALFQLIEHYKGIDVPLSAEVPEMRQLAEQLGLTEISWT